MKVRLGDYITEYKERNKKLEDIPVYSVTNSRGLCRDYFGKDVSSKDKSNYRIVPYGYFAYSTPRVNVGSIDIQTIRDRVLVSPIYTVFSVSDGMIPKYLLYYLKSDIGLFHIKYAARGSVRKCLSFAALSEFKINLPSIEEQARIVEILDTVSNIIAMRRRQITLLDEAVRSRFFEIFGDPIINNKNFPTTDLINVVKLQRGFDLPEHDRKNGTIPVFGANGIVGYHDVAKVFSGGVITGRSGSIGETYYTFGDYWPLNTSLFSVDLHGNNIIYIAYLLKFFKLSRFANRTTVFTLNRNRVHEKKIIVVPKEEQEKFSAFVEQVDKIKTPIKKSLQIIETLKKSLLQKYFI